MSSQAVFQSVKHYPYLISKFADPFFGIVIGVASYYAYERRVGRDEGHSLNELVLKKLNRLGYL
ncbi:hypothetical protein CANARDRAFT_28439 [[Candida] arabinofermentans NRRL YB-2248]|uniref:Non-classical export protein 1 n=1 Tax=[Candida] arabinofermentans NRRL YB-2248 TaxID=983967 RepID=A0A1E4T048_9ASCO|nr:hypothetical protein CANARDRAFT_28439 [[Candida] arabinofermentans NRRL YB-2248]